MPRATFTSDKLYTSEIAALQRTLRFTRQDARFTKIERNEVATLVAALVNVLNNVQSRPAKP